jgi:hypothetical protein
MNAAIIFNIACISIAILAAPVCWCLGSWVTGEQWRLENEQLRSDLEALQWSRLVREPYSRENMEKIHAAGKAKKLPPHLQELYDAGEEEVQRSRS